MCEPLSLMIGLGVASAGLNYMAASSVNSSNATAASSWANQQRSLRAQENAREEAMRLKAEEARQGAVGQMDVASQTQAREAEQARLDAQLQQDAGVQGQAPVTAGNVADTELGADTKYSPEATKTARAAAINNATAESRKRIAALAAVQSYGNSQFGLANRNQRILGESGDVIDRENLFKRGSANAYQIEAAVRPEKYALAPWVGLATGVANAAAGAAGTYAGQAAGAAGAAKFAGQQAPTPIWTI